MGVYSFRSRTMMLLLVIIGIGIFVRLLTASEGCDLTIAAFASRDCGSSGSSEAATGSGAIRFTSNLKMS